MFTVARSTDDDRPLRKRVRVREGVIERRDDDFVPPLHYTFEEKRFDALGDIAQWLRTWSRFGRYALILGELTRPAVGDMRRTGDLFRRAPAHFYIAEIDGAPFLNGYTNDDLIRNPRSVIEKHVRHYLGLTDSMGLLVSLSSSAGFEKEGKLGLRCHVWIETAYPLSPATVDLLDEKIKERLPELDTSIRSPSQLLLISPPIIDDDPFPERIFYYPGNAGNPNIPNVKDLVPATIMRQRGGTKAFVTMPPECALHGQRNKAMWNYVVAAKGSGMTCDEVISHVRERLTELQASSGTWARHGGNSLSVVSNMYRRANPGERKELYASPPFIETGGSVEQAYTDLDRDVTDAIARGGDHLFLASLGPRSRVG